MTTQAPRLHKQTFALTPADVFELPPGIGALFSLQPSKDELAQDFRPLVQLNQRSYEIALKPGFCNFWGFATTFSVFLRV